MSMSMHVAKTILKEQEKISIYDLGFVSRVFADNEQNELLQKYYEAVASYIWEQRKLKNG